MRYSSMCVGVAVLCGAWGCASHPVPQPVVSPALVQEEPRGNTPPPGGQGFMWVDGCDIMAVPDPNWAPNLTPPIQEVKVNYKVANNALELAFTGHDGSPQKGPIKARFGDLPGVRWSNPVTLTTATSGAPTLSVTGYGGQLAVTFPAVGIVAPKDIASHQEISPYPHPEVLFDSFTRKGFTITVKYQDQVFSFVIAVEPGGP